MFKILAVFCYISNVVSSNLFQLGAKQKLLTGAPLDCQRKLDVILLLDTSGSLQSFYETEKSLALDLVGFLPISASGVHLGLIKYNGYPLVEFDLNRHFDRGQMVDTISKMEFQPGVTRTGSALVQAGLLLKSGRPEANKLAILLSDGVSLDDPVEMANKLRADKTDLLVVSLSENAYKPELEQIAGSTANLYTKENFAALKARIDAIQQCGPKTALLLNSTEENSSSTTTVGVSTVGQTVTSTTGRISTSLSTVISSTTAASTTTTKGSTKSGLLVDPGNKLGVTLFGYITQWVTNKQRSLLNMTGTNNQTSFMGFTQHLNMITTELPAVTTAELNQLEDRLKGDSISNSDNAEELDDKFMMIPQLHLNEKHKSDSSDAWGRSLLH